jgi:hypothetical protein
MAEEEGKLAKQFEKVYGYKPTQRPEEDIRKAIESEIEAREQGESFFMIRYLISCLIVWFLQKVTGICG